MKNIYLLSLLSFPAISLAQPTINGSNFTSPSDENLLGIEIEYQDVSPASGANQTWDLSDVTPTGFEEEFHIIPAAGTPHENDFPTANYAWAIDELAYFYHHINDAKWDELGLAVMEDDTEITINYSNPKTILNFPLTMNSSHNDTYSGTFDGLGLLATIDGTLTSEVDAYGTLILPTGTFTDVIRVKLEYTETMSIAGNTSQTLNSTTYNFYKTGFSHPIASMHYDVYDEEDIEEFGQYYVLTTTDIWDMKSEVAFSYWPNPASDEVNLLIDSKNSSPVNVRITDLNGRLVKDEKYSLTAGRNTIQLSTEGISSGLYSLQIFDETGFRSTKLIIE